MGGVVRENNFFLTNTLKNSAFPQLVATKGSFRRLLAGLIAVCVLVDLKQMNS